MSRPTEFLLKKQCNQTPPPGHYTPSCTNEGSKLLHEFGNPSFNECMRGTFGQDKRFRHYKALALSKSNPNLGPGTHDDFVSFKTVNKRLCKVLMMPQIYEGKDVISD